MTLDVEDRLRRTLHDVASRLEVGDNDLNHVGAAPVASRPRWMPLAIAAVLVLVVGAAAALTGLGVGTDDDASVVAGPGPGVEGSALLADHLLTTSQVEGVVDGLEEDEYQTGDHAVLGPAQLGAGWTDEAISGVTRQWVRAHQWRSGDAVPERIVHVSSTILEFESRPDAEAAVDKLRAEVPLGPPIGGAPPGYAAYGPPEQEHPSDVRSWFGFKVEGRHVVSVELGAAGEVDRSEEFLALLELSNQQAGSLG